MSHMPPRPRHARKILVASMGVATMTYVIACGSSTSESSDGGNEGASTFDDGPVANLVARPDTGIPHDGSGDTSSDAGSGDTGAPDGGKDVTVSDTASMDDFPVANLVAFPDVGISDVATVDEFPVANLVAIPPDK